MIEFLLQKLHFEHLLFSSVNVLPNVAIELKTSFISNCFVLLIVFLYAITAIYSIGYLTFERDKHKIRFHVLMVISSLVTIGLAYSANLFTAFIFYDLLSFFTYMLVRHHKDDNSENHAFIYTMYLILPSMLFLFPAIIYVYVLAENVEFAANGILSNT